MDNNYAVFAITQNTITQTSHQHFFDNKSSYRKAYKNTSVPNNIPPIFKDSHCLIKQQHNIYDNGGYKQKRIFDILGQRQIPLFSDKFQNFHLASKQKKYPNFISQFCMIDLQYLNTLFFTKNVSKNGYYQYFVRRNGEFHIEYIDDLLPVDSKTQKPLWGLTQLQPWKLILAKAWIKQHKGNVKQALQAPLYDFIEAFGNPGYSLKYLSKEYDDLVNGQKSQKTKQDDQRKIPLNSTDFIVVAKSRALQKVKQFGIQPNLNAYRVGPTKSIKNKSVVMRNQSAIQASSVGASKVQNESIKQNVYKITSSVPSTWVGQFSIFANKKAHQKFQMNIQNQIIQIDKQFLVSYPELSQVFSKIYITPLYRFLKGKNHLFQETIKIKIDKRNKPWYMFQADAATTGIVTVNITLHVKQELENNEKRFPSIKYVHSCQKKGQYTPISYLYVKGYRKSMYRFAQMRQGKNYFYFQIEPRNNKQILSGDITFNINSNAGIKYIKPCFSHQNINQSKQANFPTPDVVIKPALYIKGLQRAATIYIRKDKQQKDQKLIKVSVSHTFDKYGFGMLFLQVDKAASMQLAMHFIPKSFHKYNYQIVPEFHPQIKDDDGDVLMNCLKNQKKVLIFQRIQKRITQKNIIFPPQGTVQFYKYY